MKRRVSILLSVLLVLSFTLVGCGKEAASKYEGTTWTMTGGKDASGIEVTAEQLEQVGVSDFTLELKKDGVVTASVSGTTSEGTWSEKDGELTIGMDGDNLTGTVEDNKMTVVQDDMTLIFEKK